MRYSSLILSMALCSLLTASVNAEIPQIISYQGRVTDSGGNPVADGDYTMRFRIYDAATGGTLMWDSGDQMISVNDGGFEVLLGESPQPAITLEFDEDYWLLLTVAGDDQIPRNRIGSVGYAYMASGLVAGTEVIGSVGTGTKSAIKATNASTADLTYGVYASTATTEGFGVVGIQPGYVPETDVGGYLKPGGFFGGNNGVMGISKAQYGFGVLGLSQATTGDGCGGFFQSAALSGKGVHGAATATMGTNYGVYGTSSSNDGRGVYGYAGSTNGNTYGIYGRSASTSGRGVYGYASTSTGTTYGVHGQSASTDGTGVFGYTSAQTGTTYGGRFESYSVDGIGVYAKAWPTTGTTYGGKFENYSAGGVAVYGDAATGVYGRSAFTHGKGVYGDATATTGGVTYGVYGSSASPTGYGVFGGATATTGANYGVWGKSASTSGRGVRGTAWAFTGFTYAGLFECSSPDGVGVRSNALNSSGLNYGVYARTYSPNGFGGFFEGDVHVTGALSKGSGSFLIDHPLDPENKLLRHNFVESPENLLIYRGTIQLDGQGKASVELPTYFAALTLETEASVQLTPLGVPFLVGYEWGTRQASFTIHGDAHREVSWMVLADRDDPVIHQYARPVEEEKGPDNKYCKRGKLLYPKAYGYPESVGRDYELHEKERQQMEEERARMEEERLRRQEERAELHQDSHADRSG